MKEHTISFPLINYKLLPLAFKEYQLTKISFPIKVFYTEQNEISYQHM